MAETNHWYLHVDLDAFFASVEQLDHPEYRGKPVIVGGKPDDRRSVVSTASYEARKFGVHSAMPTFQAYKLCPDGIYVHGRMERYAELSFQIMNIFREYSPDVDQMSIDEAFIDLTGTERLFGPPEETAIKIKAQVKKETGLTVSAGLASTKYLAKIASGYSKPDGFYYIHKGDEQSFMLNLPLTKVWGLGEKSLALLRSKGIKTTRDIYDYSYETLEFMFGQNMAAFLYQVVRGQEKDSFNRKTKTHSISAETTFPYDLTDIYTIETELLELSQGVYFRLLKEQNFSRTAFVKIRYEDFSTCTVQETVERNIITLDTYYEIVKGLFEKKYDKNRGIRLLGVGLDNLEKEEKPFQQDLFANNDEKKQAVEKAILNLQTKHPEIKVRKARTLKGLITGALLALTAISPLKAYADSSVTQKGAAAANPDTFYTPEDKAPDKDSRALFDWNIDDKNNVEFTLTGFWKGEFSDSVLFSFGNDTVPAFSLDSPVFKQEVELSAWVFLNKHWFFEADFAEQFSKNTIAMGYEGTDFVRSVRVSNRGISFAGDYSADVFGFGLKGGNNQAPGVSAHFKSADDKLEIDALLRYDMTETHSATYYGMNSVTDTKLSIADFAYGHAFRFPENCAVYFSNIKNVYVETKQGSFRDSSGRRYKKLSTTDYYYSTIENRLYLSQSADAGKQDNSIPTVLISFGESLAIQNIINQTGSYEDDTSFAGLIQAQFNAAEKKYNLKDYTTSLTTTIDSVPALVIQSSTGFNPYVCPDTYDEGLTADADILVMDNSTELTLSQYSADSEQLNTAGLYEDFFTESHTFAKITFMNEQQSIYPFVTLAPEIYLNLPDSSNLSIVLRTYDSITEYEIGTEASKGTVQAYVNNVLDTGALYDQSTGVVSLSTSVQATDKVYITWQEDASDFSKGELAGGAGLKYHFTPELTGDFSVTARWPLISDSSYSTADNIKQGFAAFSTGISYVTPSLELSNKTAFSVQKDNAASKLLVNTQSDNTPQTYYLDSSSGYSTKTVPCLNIKQNAPVLTETGNKTVNSHKGVSDSYITGYKIPLSWSFDSSSKNQWAAVDIQLGSGYLLKKSSKFNFAVKPEISRINQDVHYDFYLQLGIKAASDFYGEDNTTIPTWKLDSIDISDTQWQTISVSIDDTDKALLASNWDARLIVVCTDSADGEQGTIYFGPYEPVLQSLTAEYDENLIVNTTSYDNGGSNYSSVINWNLPSTAELNQIKDTCISTVSYFKAADFNSYKSIQLKLAVNGSNQIKASELNTKDSSPGFTLILDDGEKSALILQLQNLSPYFSDIPDYAEISINLEDSTVYINDQQLSPSDYSLSINKDVIPLRQKMSINLIQGDAFYKTGSLYINDLSFSDTKLYTNLQNQASASYHSTEDILTIGNYTVLKDAEADFTSTQSLTNLASPTPVVQSSAKAGITAAGIKLSTDAAVKNLTLRNSGHTIKSEEPISGVLSLEESYRFNPEDKSLKKNNQLSLDFNAVKVPLVLSGVTSAVQDYTIQTQKSKVEEKLELPFGSSGFSLNWKSYFDTNQKINTAKTAAKAFECENYFNSWYDISTLQFSSGSPQASLRNCVLNTNLEGIFPFAQFKPAFTYEIKSDYTSSIQSELTDTTTLLLQLPFSINTNSFSFNFQRTGSSTNIQSSDGDYFKDFQTVLERQEERTWLYTSIPFYELFDLNLNDKISANYNTKYETVYKRKLYNSFKDLYIPSSASFAVCRNISKTSSTADLYQYKAVITNNSLNNFGSLSQKQYFKWFRQEEIISSLTGIVKVPVDLPENTTFLIAGYTQLLFMISDKNTLTTAFDASFETNMDWSTHGTIIYARQGKNCMITEGIKALVPSARNIVFEIKRKDTLNYELSQTDNILSQKYSYQHNVDFSFLKYFTVTTGLGTNLTFTQNKASVLGINATIGAKAEF